MTRGWLLALALLLAGCHSAEVRRSAGKGARPAGEVAPDPLATAKVGFVVYDPAKREIVAQQNAADAYLPASVAKIPTVLFALETLGPGHRFRTTLSFRGARAKGEWTGDLVLHGTGDPVLTDSDLMDLALRLRGAGFRKLTGRFLFDDSYLGRADQIDATVETDVAYNSGVGALSAEFNRVTARWDAVRAYTIPALPWIQVTAGPAASGRPAYSGVEGREQWSLSPSGAPGLTELPVKDAGRFTAGLFRVACDTLGLVVPEPQRGKAPAKAVTIARHESPPLWEVAGRAMEFSNNLVAELLLLASARKVSGRPLGIPEAAAMASARWTARHPDVGWAGLVLPNGSGLSARARLSPLQLLAMLEDADARDFGGHRFQTLLPVAGLKGTLRDRLHAPEAQLRAWAKTGTVNYGTGLAGYLFPRSGRPLLFVAFVSDLKKRAEEDAAPGMHPREADDWVDRGRRALDALVTEWVATL